MQASPFFILMRRAALPALCLLVIGYFLTHALFGPTGYLALDDIRAEHAAILARNAELKQQRAALERDIALLSPQGADRDFADELVRRHLGVICPDELVIPLKPAAPPSKAAEAHN